MFERAYNRLVKSVMKSGKPAQAEVLSGEVDLGPWRKGESWGNVSNRWKVSLRVTPQDAPPFDLQTKMEIPMLMAPRLGMTLQVIYNPKKPDEIVVDPASVPTDPVEASKTDAANAMRALEIEADRLPEPAEPVADPVAAAQDAAHEVLAHPAPGDQAAAALLRAQREALAAAMAGPPPSPPPAGATEAAIEAKLAQLEALKAAGVLDEQSYAASRQRLIDALLR